MILREVLISTESVLERNVTCQERSAAQKSGRERLGQLHGSYSFSELAANGFLKYLRFSGGILVTVTF